MTKKQTSAKSGSIRAPLKLAIVALLAGGGALTSTEVAAGGSGHDFRFGFGGQRVCAQTTQIAYVACGNDVQDNYQIAVAKCLNLTDWTEKSQCMADAKSTRQDEVTQCGDVRDARLHVCDTLTIGGGPYDPEIDPTNFVPADQIVGNMYFPLKPGTQWVYENTDDETITVTVTDQTAEIEGIPVRVVTDVVQVGGETTENTEDWYAQDWDGNIWYIGENTVAFDPDTMLSSVEGAWVTGVDGAKPGIIMPAVFTVGDVYRQEWLLGDAEDIAENLSNTEAMESAPTYFATPAVWKCSDLGNCLKTHEYSPLEPDKSESKFYYPGVGVIVTLDDNDSEFREELVEFNSP